MKIESIHNLSWWVSLSLMDVFMAQPPVLQLVFVNRTVSNLFMAMGCFMEPA